MLEVYNENIFDLLGSDSGNFHVPLKIRMSPDGGNYIENLSERKIASMEEVMAALDEADRSRTTAATKMNAHSSRSHLIMTITVEGVNKVVFHGRRMHAHEVTTP